MKKTGYYVILNLLLLILATAVAAVFIYNESMIKSRTEKQAEIQLVEDAQAKSEAHDALTELYIGPTEAVVAAYESRYPENTENMGNTENTAEETRGGLSILMYHTVYDPLDPPQRRIDNNYISTVNLEEQLQYLTEEGYSFPTWKDVRRYIDGEMNLPEKSVVLTFDDGTDGFRKYGVPLLNKYKVPATAFIIVSKNGKKWAEHKEDYPYLDLESHSYNMHRPGGRIGHGGIMTRLSYSEVYTDLKMSQAVLGNSNAFSYPFGDVDQLGQCREAVEGAGFIIAVTTKYGRVYPGADPLMLPRMRVNGRNSLAAFMTLL